MSRGKIEAKRVEEDGIIFDSLAELRRYRDLKVLLHNGNIANLRVHPVFELQPAFKTLTGKKIRRIIFKPDFEYYENGVHVVEDVKPFKNKIRKGVVQYDDHGRPEREPYLTHIFRLRVNMFLYQNQDIDFRIVES